MDTAKKLEIIEKALDDKKASQIEILDVKEQTSLGDYFVIASCQSTTQVKACADEVEEKMSEAGEAVRHTEGYRNSNWILMDYGDVIVHVMQQEMREFYALERLWDDVEKLTEKESE